jgi:hypothetical protein
MEKSTIDDFENGDQIYHLTNSRRTMVVIGINKESNEVTCRWLDDSGISHKEEFFASELAKITIRNTGYSISGGNRSSKWRY